MKALLLSLSLIGAVVGTSFAARADDDYNRYYERHDRHRDRDEDRFDHDWRDDYWHHNRYGYWHGERGHWAYRHHHYVFIPAPPA